MLVLGNHEFNGSVDGHVAGFDAVYSTLYLPGSPELLLTHLPLRDVPDGCVNVHGHVHTRAPLGTRHVNVAVEQTRYRPRALTAVRRLAASLVRGERVPGRTTAQQLVNAGPAATAGGMPS